MIDVDPQDRGEPVARVLTTLERVARRAAVTQRDIQVAIGAEDNAAAVMVLERVLVRDPDPLLALRVGHARVIGTNLEPRDHRVPGPLVVGRVIDEELAVLFVLRVEGQTQQPLLVLLVDRVGKLQELALVLGLALVRKRLDRRRVLFDHEQKVTPVVRVRQGDRPVELQVRKADLGRQARQGLCRRRGGCRDARRRRFFRRREPRG